MTYTIRNAKIIDSNSKWSGKQVDMIIKDGRIHKIGKSLRTQGDEIKVKGLHLSPGWIDMHAHFCDPGHEYKENLTTGLSAAKKGGFTSVVTMPVTSPVVDSKSSIEYILSKSSHSGVKVYPAACISKGAQGKELSEMIDLSQAGAKLFTDDKSPVSDTSLMNRALLYAKNIQGIVCSFPMDSSVAAAGKMNEGKVSTRLGVTGIPHMAESIQLKRDLDLLRYTESKIHIVGLSTAGGVKLVKDAKKEGLRVTAEVHLANLIWTDDELSDYNSNFKLFPPLRTEKDRKALIKGVNDGTIDCISSDHRPEDIEHKKLEFGQANYGIALIESFYPLYNSYLAKDLSLGAFIRAITLGPCTVLNIPSATIEEGQQAVLTLFSPSSEADTAPIHTKAYNTPCIHEEVKGSVIMTVR